MATPLEQARQALRQAERDLAELDGQRRAAESALQEAATQLATLGVAPEEVDATLQRLTDEEGQIKQQIATLERELSGVLDQAPATVTGTPQAGTRSVAPVQPVLAFLASV